MDLICIFLTCKDIEHLLMCLFPICVSYLGNIYSGSLPIYSQVVFVVVVVVVIVAVVLFLMLSSINSSYILDINTLSDVLFAKILCKQQENCVLFFSFVDDSLTRGKAFDQVTFVYFCF